MRNSRTKKHSFDDLLRLTMRLTGLTKIEISRMLDKKINIE